MKIIEIKKTDKYHVFSIDVDNETWKKEQEKVIKNLALTIRVDGYRKGKVPFEIAAKKIPKNEVIDRSVRNQLNKIINEVFQSEEFKKIEDDILDLPPKVELTNLSENDFQLKLSYYIYPDVNVDGYKDIKIKSILKTPTSTDIDKEIDNYLTKNSMNVPKENGSIVKGDIATFSFKGYVGGKPFEGGEAKNYELTIGSGQFIPGFEDQMIGMSINDKKDINVVFPIDYHQKDLAGKQAKFEVEIHSISQIEKPKLDDDFVKSLNIKDVETVDALKKHITKNLTMNYEQQYEQEKKQEIYRAILDIVKISWIPEELIQKEKRTLLNQVEQQVAMYGIKLDDYINIMGMNKEEFEKQQEESAKQKLKISMAILKICELEKIETTEQELEEELEKASKILAIVGR